MADIGATLREARMRQRIDITDMEVGTKIRAKYLRALENEEWDALPGPAYVKSFLRTYADALGLDAKRIVEEYKVRHERPSEVDLHPIRGGRGGIGRDRRRRERRGVPGWAVAGVVLAGILVALYFVGRDQDDRVATPASTGERPASTGGDGDSARADAGERPQRRTVSLRLIATGDVSVCLVDAAGRVRVRDETLGAGERTDLFRSRAFRMVLGNNAVTLRVNGRDRTLAPSSEPIARRLTRQDGLQPLPADRRPTCS